MMRRFPLRCAICGTELKTDLDCYGDIGEDVCIDCWYDNQPDDVWYGQAPHHHNMTLTGSFIGSTVFEPLPPDSEKHPVYGYWIESAQAYFRPDEEVGGDAGLWTRRPKEE